MRQREGQQLRGPGEVSRRTVVAAAILALLIITSLSWQKAGRPGDVGLTAVATGDLLRVERVRPAGLAWNAGIRPGDTVIGVDGATVIGAVDPAVVARASAVTVLAPGGETRSASVDALTQNNAPMERFALLAIGWSFVAVGCGVFLLVAETRPAWLFLAFALAGGTALITATATPTGPSWALAVEYVAVAGFGATTFLLFLNFPVDRWRSRPGRALATGCLGLLAALLIAYSLVAAGDGGGYAILRPVLHACLAIQLSGAVVLLFLGRSRVPRAHDRRRALNLVGLGAVAGLFPFCLLALIPNALGFGYLIRPEVAILSAGVLPIALGTAILGGQFLGITRVVRRSLVALVAWAGLLLAYALVFEAARRYVSPVHPLIDAGLGLPLVVAAVAATFPPLQRRLRSALEARLFQDTYDYVATLESLATEIALLSDLGAIADCALLRLGLALDLAWATLTLDASGPSTATRQWTWSPVGNPTTSVPPAASLPLVADGQRIGHLALGPKRHDDVLLPEDEALVATAAPLIATALHSATLVQHLEEQVAALEVREGELAALSARLLHVQEEERRRLAFDLHDEPLQGAILLAREVGEAAGPQAERWRARLEDLIAALRATCEGLRPPVLDDLGLVPALERLIRETRARGDLDAQLCLPEGEAIERLDPALETALYRVAQEALHNTVKHAAARRVAVRLARCGDRIHLEIADDGRGVARADTPVPTQLGLLGMRERLRPWAGTVTISSPPGGGAVVSVSIAVKGDG